MIQDKHKIEGQQMAIQILAFTSKLAVQLLKLDRTTITTSELSYALIQYFDNFDSFDQIKQDAYLTQSTRWLEQLEIKVSSPLKLIK